MIAEGDLIRERYLVESRIASGAMGVVWRALDQRLQRAVAIKQLFLRPGLDSDEVERINRRAVREGRITAQLAHPHAIAMYDVIEHESQVCLIMEYLPSASLAAVVTQQGVLPADKVAEIGRQVASALQSAHTLGVLHRDVKPGNILVAENGTAKVSDFGISRGLDGHSTTSTGLFAGTVAYLAPEVAKGGTPGFPSDVFSLGASLYAAVQGTPPFGFDENALALLHRVAFDEVTPPDCGDPLRGVLLRMLDRNPDTRPTMAEAHAELAAAAGAATVAGVVTPAAIPSAPGSAPAHDPEPTKQGTLGAAPATGAATGSAMATRKKAAIALGGAAALLIVAALAFALSTTRPTPAAAPPPSTVPPPVTTTPAPPSPSTPTGSAAPPVTTAAPTTPAPSPAPAPAATPPAAIASYYALMPDDLQGGWSRLTDRYTQGHGGYSGYTQFWGEIARVDATQISTVGDGQVTATIRYVYKTGRVVVEQTTFGLVLDGGQWKIDSTSVNSSVG